MFNPKPYPVDPQLGTEAVFLIQPANQAILEGKTRRLRHRPSQCAWFVTAFILVWSVGWLAGCYAMLNQYLDAKREIRHSHLLEENGSSIQGMLVGQRIQEGDSSDRYFITYRFDLDGQTYGREQQIDRIAYHDLPRESRITIRYLAADPTISSAVINDGLPIPDADIPLWVLLIFNAIGLGTLLGWGYAITLYVTNRWRLYQAGQVVLGYVLEATQDKDSDGDLTQSVKLWYHFQNPQGVWIEGTTHYALKPKLDNFPLRGTPLAVLYAHDQAHWVL